MCLSKKQKQDRYEGLIKEYQKGLPGLPDIPLPQLRELGQYFKDPNVNTNKSLQNGVNEAIHRLYWVHQISNDLSNGNWDEDQLNFAHEHYPTIPGRLYSEGVYKLIEERLEEERKKNKAKKPQD